MPLAKIAGLATIAGLLGSVPNLAQAGAYEFTQSSVITSDSATYTLGTQFTTVNAVEVTRLGYYDLNGDGLNQSHEVGIFDGAGNLLVKMFVPAGTGGILDGHYRYVDLGSPLVLAANALYVIAGTNSGTADAYAYGARDDGVLTGFVTNPSIKIADDAARYNQNAGLLFPTSTYLPYTFYGGANFEITAVPEPATLGLLASFVVVGAIRRHVRRKRE